MYVYIYTYIYIYIEGSDQAVRQRTVLPETPVLQLMAHGWWEGSTPIPAHADVAHGLATAMRWLGMHSSSQGTRTSVHVLPCGVFWKMIPGLTRRRWQTTPL